MDSATNRTNIFGTFLSGRINSPSELERSFSVVESSASARPDSQPQMDDTQFQLGLIRDLAQLDKSFSIKDVMNMGHVPPTSAMRLVQNFVDSGLFSQTDENTYNLTPDAKKIIE